MYTNKVGNHTEQRLIRILHVVGGMNVGGVETWLMRVLQEIDHTRFEMDFLVNTTESCFYDDELRKLGYNVISCPYLQRPWLYGSNFKRLLQQHGPYDVVHSHIHYFNGYILRLAEQAAIPIRIAHSHIDISSEGSKVGFLRYLYLKLMKFWIAQYATKGLACSRKAAADLFSSDWELDPRWQILYYGIDLVRFQEAVDSTAIRFELGIPADAFVIGHVGRFTEQKNHRFLVEIVTKVAKHYPNTYLLLIGDGLLRPSIERYAAQMGLTKQVVFAGIRSDVSQLMLGAINVFVMPSLYEGLPVVGIEAQAAGLPLVLSDTITPEIEIFKSSVQRISLSQPASVWANAVLEVHEASSQLTFLEKQIELKKSPFNILNCVKALRKVYE